MKNNVIFSNGLLSVASAASLILVQSADAAFDAFLKIDGIEGESTDDKHKNEIDILAWSWGMSRSGPTNTGGGGAAGGDVAFQDMTFMKAVDKASPKLMEACASGRSIPTLTLNLTGDYNVSGVTTFESQPYLTIILEDCIVASYKSDYNDGDTRPMESFSLNFTKIEYRYNTFDATTYDPDTSPTFEENSTTTMAILDPVNNIYSISEFPTDQPE